MNGTLYGVSVGPGDPGLITVRAVEVIRACGVIAVPRSSGGAERVALGIAENAVPELGKKELVELSMPMTRDPDRLEAARVAAVESLAAYLRAGRDVAFLTIGDVTVYSTYGYLHERVKAMGFPAEMIAGVPSFCAAAARLGEPLTDAAKPLHIIPAPYEGLEEALGLPGTKVLMKSGKYFGEVRRLLAGRGTDARIVERCGLSDERVYRSLADAPEDAGYLSIIMVKE